MVGTRGVEKSIYLVDSGYVVKGVARIAAGARHASNVDLWRLVEEELQNREVACVKVGSHMTVAEVLTRRVSAGVFLANQIADSAASRAAEGCQLSHGEFAGLQWSETVVASVRSRLAATFLDAVAKDV